MAKITEALGVDNAESLDRNDYMEFRQELESNGSLTSKFDREFFDAVYPGKGYKDYLASVDNDLGQIIEDAKAGNEYAECYLIIAARKMCYYVFWKVFIGHAASAKVIATRLDNGDFGEFIGIMFIAFDKAIRSFKPKIYKDGTMKIGNWQYWFGQYLRMDCISENVQRAKDPIEGAMAPDGMDDSEKGGATAWDKVTGEEHASHIESDEFTDSWLEFCNDPYLDEPCSKKVDLPKRKLLADILEGKKTLPEMAEEAGVSKNTLYTAANVGHLLAKYDINQEMLAKALHDDPEKVLSMLRRTKSLSEGTLNEMGMRLTADNAIKALYVLKRKFITSPCVKDVYKRSSSGQSAVKVMFDVHQYADVNKVLKLFDIFFMTDMSTDELKEHLGSVNDEFLEKVIEVADLIRNSIEYESVEVDYDEGSIFVAFIEPSAI